MKKIVKFWPIIVILFLAIWVRFIHLDQAPSSLYYDEIDLGYQAQSLLETGKDYRGNFSPYFFRSFNTDKTPVPVLFSAFTSLFFKTPEYQVRSGTALVGVIVVLLAMILIFQLSGSKTAVFLSGLVFAFSPWLIHFSRLAFEAEYVLFFLFAFLVLFFHWLKTGPNTAFYTSAVVLGLSIYTYRTMSFLAPVMMILTPLYFKKEFLLAGVKKSLLWLGLVLILIIPFLYATTIGSKDQTRISQISIFSDPMIPIEVQRSRELVSGNFQDPTPGQTATLQSKIFHNKILSYLEKLRDNTFRNFSPDFLFLTGDTNGRHSAKNTGELLFLDLIALIGGLYFLYLHLKDKKYSYLLILLFLGAVPANLTMDGANHASRLITFSGPLLLVVSLGYFSLFTYLAKLRHGKIISALIVSVWLFAVSQFLSKYFYEFPVTNSREFGYGFKQAIQKITPIVQNYDKLYLTDVNDPPILYYLFWANIPPRELQLYGTDFSLNTVKNLPLDQVRPYYPETALCEEKQILSLQPNILYLVAYKNLPLDFRSPDKDKVPQGIKLIDVIKYPDNEVAYYLLTRDRIGGKPVNPLKGQNCEN